jgi:hypothetical protein
MTSRWYSVGSSSSQKRRADLVTDIPEKFLQAATEVLQRELGPSVPIATCRRIARETLRRQRNPSLNKYGDAKPPACAASPTG